MNPITAAAAGDTLLKKVEAFAINSSDTRRSLSERSQFARMCPSLLYDRDIGRMDRDVYQNILHTTLDLYIGQYMMVVLSMVKVGNVTVEAILDPMATNRRVIPDFVTESSFKDVVTGAMVSPSAYHFDQSPTKRLVMYNEPVYTQEAAKDMIGDFGKPTSIAVGKVIHVPIYDNEGKLALTVPVVATLAPRLMDREHISKVFEMFIGNDNTALGRFARFWAGDLDAKDFFLSTDLIRAERKLMLDDTEGFYREAKSGQSRGLLSQFISGKRSLATASAILVVSKATAEMFEAAMKGSLNSPSVRQKMFETLNSAMLIVVNPQTELVKIYQRGVDNYGTHTFGDIAKSGNAGAAGNNINDIIKAVKMSESFNF